MSAYRDGLPDDAARARYDQAVKAAGLILAHARLERDQLAAAEGTQAVAEAAWYPGHALGSVEAIQGRYEALREEARRRTAGGGAG
ncbi:MAG TPA: hypothetical protein VFQ68_00290 [Streptosporangiaceae bacterium]|nr:hypothetical protein [Streptosporangiaceae bacterium]